MGEPRRYVAVLNGTAFVGMRPLPKDAPQHGYIEQVDYEALEAQWRATNGEYQRVSVALRKAQERIVELERQTVNLTMSDLGNVQRAQQAEAARDAAWNAAIEAAADLAKHLADQASCPGHIYEIEQRIRALTRGT